MTFLERFKKRCSELAEAAPEITVLKPEREPEVRPVRRRFNIHKRSLPVGVDKIVVFNLPSKEAAQRLIDKAVDSQGKPLFATRSYNDDAAESKTLIYYDIVPEDATPKERSIYFNPRPTVLE